MDKDHFTKGWSSYMNSRIFVKNLGIMTLRATASRGFVEYQNTSETVYKGESLEEAIKACEHRAKQILKETLAKLSS